jgi:hypothetical protein
LLAFTVTLVLAVPGTANAVTLDQLLDLPLEQLLQLKITSIHAPQLSARWPLSPRGLRAEHHDAT